MGRGVVAVGDSIINGGTRQKFTTPQSWAQHLAEQADLPFTKYARGGHTSQQVRDEQLPCIRHDDYDVAAVTVGANDVLLGWDAGRFEANLSAILSRLSEVAQRVVVSNLPAGFRFDPSPANRVIAEQAERHGAVLLDVRDLVESRWLLPDRVHPTAIGLAEMGQRAASLLGHDRLAPDARRLSATYRVRHAAESAVQAARWRLRG